MISIILLICVLIEALTLFLYNKILFSTHRSFFCQGLTFFLAYLLVFIVHNTSSYQKLVVNIIVFFSVNTFIFLFMHSLTVASAIIRSAMLTGFSILSEVIVGNVLEYITNNYWTEWNSEHNLSLMSLSVLIYSLLAFSAACVEKHVRSLDKLKIMAVPLGFLAFLTLLAITINYFNFYKIFSQFTLTTINICIFIALLFGDIFIYAYMYRAGITISQQKQQVQIEKDHVDFVDKMQERDLEQRILIHDIKNHLVAISELSDKGDVNSVKNYIDDLLNASLLKPSVQYCDNDFVNSIINRYKEDAEKNNLEFIVTSNIVELSFINNYDLTVLLCNLFENAVEAATKTEKPFIHATFSFDSEKEISIISIVNSCSERVKFVNGLPVTSKPNPQNHGLGIKSIKRVVEKYNGAINMYQDNDNTFHVVIALDRGDSVCE